MIIIKLDKAQYEYDIHSLVKAFYPEAEVRILTPHSVIKDKKILALPHTMELTFGENGEPVTLRIAEPDGSLAAEDEKTGRREPERLYTWHPDEEEKTEYKNAFKRFLYKSLQKETGLTLPWGNLTGIRPTKIAMNMLEEGENTAQIEAFLRTRHLVSGEKAALSIDIAQREQRILSSLHYDDGYSLYIGIPFCPTTCLYCSFTSFPPFQDFNELKDALDYIGENL